MKGKTVTILTLSNKGREAKEPEWETFTETPFLEKA
jgi:hypothetical protein